MYLATAKVCIELIYSCSGFLSRGAADQVPEDEDCSTSEHSSCLEINVADNSARIVSSVCKKNKIMFKQ